MTYSIVYLDNSRVYKGQESLIEQRYVHQIVILIVIKDSGHSVCK